MEVIRKFDPAWKKVPELQDWVEEDPANLFSAKCGFCKCFLRGKLNSLKLHAASRKHLISSGVI